MWREVTRDQPRGVRELEGEDFQAVPSQASQSLPGREPPKRGPRQAGVGARRMPLSCEATEHLNFNLFLKHNPAFPRLTRSPGGTERLLLPFLLENHSEGGRLGASTLETSSGRLLSHVVAPQGQGESDIRRQDNFVSIRPAFPRGPGSSD